MTMGRAILIKLISIYSAVEDSLSRLEIQKLCYFTQEAGESLRLSYVKNQYGSYADNLRHVFTTIEGHFLKGVRDQDTSISQITLMPEALNEADKFLVNNSDSCRRIESVSELIGGFEGPYGMELLSTVHWVCTKEPNAQNLKEVIEAIYNWDESHPEWNNRKRSLMSEKDISIAWEHLTKLGWIGQ